MITTMLLCVLLLSDNKTTPIEVTIPNADASRIRSEIVKQSAREGWSLCGESESQLNVCSDWHSRVVARFRYRRRFIINGSTVTAFIESCSDARGPNGAQTGQCVELKDKKNRAKLADFLRSVQRAFE